MDNASRRFVHDTEDGLIVSEAKQLGENEWLAHHWGPQLDGGGTFRSLGAAMTYLRESFEQMFPEHQCCTDRCEVDELERQPRGLAK